jgi:hypothetical protein
MWRLRFGGLGGIDDGVEAIRAALLLKIGNLIVEQLDVVLALARVPTNTRRRASLL